MENSVFDWSKKHILKTNSEFLFTDEDIEAEKFRSSIEPWLSTIFQSDHFSLLVGSGLTTGVTHEAALSTQAMGRLEIENEFNELIMVHADNSAKNFARGIANLEDDLRTAYELLKGLLILDDTRNEKLKADIDNYLNEFIKRILETERNFKDNLTLECSIGEDLLKKIKTAIENEGKIDDIVNGLEGTEKDEAEKCIKQLKAERAFLYFRTFLLSFSSRAATRERLNIFTTNYDRFIEFGCDEVGIILLDRFKGKLIPLFRNTKLELDYHYNPPGIRGEPRYVEGVVRITKIHGSIDWRFKKDKITRALLPFGAPDNHTDLTPNASDHVVIYPNSSKDIETAFYPYAELFRDFSSAICKPNSCVVTFGYGFGDTHINRIMEDMLTIPSTHLVIISFDTANGRIEKFFKDKNKSQFTLLIGPHFGNLVHLVDNYLPKSSIDRLTIRMQKLKENRGETSFKGQLRTDKEDTKIEDND